MREVNFSIPNVNKASVHITTTLYDRRALDCTSTLPLINSLNHLAYLTTSSARIRDILTVDGGVERLVSILKEGRSKDEMHMWKWNLAFQCIVNIGVRGTENVRTRVVEADMVPVIATILWDYIQVIEREKAKADAEQARHSKHCRSLSKTSKPSREAGQHEPSARSSFFEHVSGTSDHRTRRQAPPPSLDIQQSSQNFHHAAAPEPASVGTATAAGTPAAAAAAAAAATTTAGQPLFTSPPERTVFGRPHSQSQPLHHLRGGHDTGRGSGHRSSTGSHTPATASAIIPSSSSSSSMDASDGFSLRPVRDVDRLPSMLPPLQPGIASNPDSPTTPSAPAARGLPQSPAGGRRPHRPSIRHQLSTSSEPDDGALPHVPMASEAADAEDGSAAEPSGASATASPARRDATPPEVVDESAGERLHLTIPDGQDVDSVDIAQQQTPTAANMMTALATQTADDGTGTSPLPNAPTTAASPAIPLNAYPNFFLRNATSGSATHSALMPRDEDVLMGLQLLAYISKYCYLRHYFQATHLVPRLRIDREVDRIYGPLPGGRALPPEPGPDEMEEFLQADDYNIFPLVEKFTVRCHSKDMQYWACVVMRNLCRKDDERGGIRQCANYQCGKWEEYTRQFAKCRRCRRTKYCSKECQRESWSMHRHWCQTSP